MATPGGGSYRANITETGVKNPWPPVQVGVLTWTKDTETLAVFYRSDIEAKAGEAHTDIVMVSAMETLDREKNKLVLYAAEVPKDITVTDAAHPAARGAYAAAALYWARYWSLPRPRISRPANIP